MNGGDELLREFVFALSPDDLATVISLPQEGPQDYAFLAGHVSGRLPDSPYVLIAESFSGPIAAMIASQAPTGLEAVIFVATFLSSPNSLATLAGRSLPLKALLRMPFASWFLKRLFLGSSAPVELVERVIRTVEAVPTATLRHRIDVMRSLQYDATPVAVPAFYLRPEQDSLVPRKRFDEFQRFFEHIECIQLPGPHALLQRYPGKSAELVRRLVASL